MSVDPFSEAERAAIDRLVEAYYARHGAAIDLIKAEVGEGQLYVNTIARAMVSRLGAWCEVIELPVEFSGIAGPGAMHRLVTDAEAMALARDLAAETRADLEQEPAIVDLLALYSASGLVDHEGVYLWRAPSESGRGGRSVGEFQQDTIPLFLRARLSGAGTVPGLSIRRGVVALLADVGDLHLILEMPHEGGPVHDLGTGYGAVTPQ